MASVEQMRKMVTEAYPRSSEWPDKVKKMTDPQIQAVFLRLKESGRIK